MYMSVSGENENVYCFSCVDESGNVIKGNALNVDGRIVHPNENGVFRFVDGEYLDSKLKKIIAEEEYIDKIMTLALVSDQVCENLFGCDVMEKFKEQGCLPSQLDTLDVDSTTYTVAFSKFRSVVINNLPIVDGIN